MALPAAAYPDVRAPEAGGPAPASPLDAYSQGDFYFATEGGVLLASGGGAVAAEVSAAESSPAVREVLRGRTDGDGRPARVVGAVPFDTRRPAHLVLPDRVRTAPAALSRRPDAPQRPHHADGNDLGRRKAIRTTEIPSPDGHMEAVEAALEAMRSDPELRKLVIARTMRLRGDGPVDPVRVLDALRRRHPEAYTFAARMPSGADDAGGAAGRGTAHARTMVGASPELLASRRGERVRSCPLAGSAARSIDPDEDRRRAELLQASAKDQVEHAIVVEAIADALAPLCATLVVPPRPILVSTPTMWHLATPISGTVADPEITSLDLALALHPTPAICGTPTDRARDRIDGIEAFDRGFYSGFVGWCDADGDGEWAIAIRCAELAGPTARLYAGGGIVPGSDPAAELAETTAKFRTMLDAVGEAMEPDPALRTG